MKLVITLLLIPTLAFADKADDLFKQGKKLMAEKKYADACPKFEESFKIDAGLGTELNIARCYEEWGKLGKAYHTYTDALKRADDAKDSRTAKIKELVAKLEPQVPRIVIHIPEGSDAAGLQVAIDGVPVDDVTAPQLVDPGPKQVEYALGSGARKKKTVPVERNGTSDITLELPKGKGETKTVVATKTKTEPPPVIEEQPNVGHGQRVAGVAIAGVGVVAVGVSAYLALSARSKYNDALHTNCMDMTNACNAQGLTDTHDARSSANIATIIGGVGLAAVATGIIVYAIAPHASASTEHALYVAPTTNGFALGGQF